MSEKLHVHKTDSSNTEFVINNMPSKLSFEETSILFQLLNDPTRLQIFWILCHSEECVFNIAKIVNISSPLVSFHLRFLKQSKIITSTRKGKEVHYRLNDTEFANTLKEMTTKILSLYNKTSL